MDVSNFNIRGQLRNQSPYGYGAGAVPIKQEFRCCRFNQTWKLISVIIRIMRRFVQYTYSADTLGIHLFQLLPFLFLSATVPVCSYLHFLTLLVTKQFLSSRADSHDYLLWFSVRAADRYAGGECLTSPGFSLWQFIIPRNCFRRPRAAQYLLVLLLLCPFVV